MALCWTPLLIGAAVLQAGIWCSYAILPRRTPRLREHQNLTKVTWLTRGSFQSKSTWVKSSRGRPESQRSRVWAPSWPNCIHRKLRRHSHFICIFLCSRRKWSVSNLIHVLQSEQHNSLTTRIQAGPQGDQKNEVRHLDIMFFTWKWISCGRGQNKNSPREWETKPLKQLEEGWDNLHGVKKGLGAPKKGRDRVVCFFLEFC